ncbi:MAG: hypothetical protein K2N52_01885 [Clostridia bacterium]|nr:hypothetical protein [Clostridia bacterium]
MKIERLKLEHYKVSYEPYETEKIGWCEAIYPTGKDAHGEVKFFGRNGDIISRFNLSMSGYKNAIPVSYDGKKVYSYCTTGVKPYLSCYEIESGTRVWANDSKDLREICQIELLGEALVCEIFELGICLIDANTGEIVRWILRNSGLSMWRITREYVAIWNCYKMKMYCYDIENDELRVLPTDFNAKKHFKDLVTQGNIPNWNVHLAMNQVKVDNDKLKVRLFISYYDFGAEFFEDVPMSEVIGKGEIFVYKPKKKQR